MSTQSDFDTTYILSRPPAVQALYAGTCGQSGTELDPNVRIAQAKQLSGQGINIDIQLDAWGWDPYWIMQARIIYGQTTMVGSLGQPLVISVDPLRFPPYTPPAAPVPTPTSTNLVGLQNGPGYQLTNLAISMVNAGILVNGQVISENSHTYTLQIDPFLMGTEMMWIQHS